MIHWPPSPLQLLVGERKDNLVLWSNITTKLFESIGGTEAGPSNREWESFWQEVATRLQILWKYLDIQIMEANSKNWPTHDKRIHRLKACMVRALLWLMTLLSSWLEAEMGVSFWLSSIVILLSYQYSILANNLYCNTAYLNLTSNSWTSGPQMSVCRRHATCNLITNSSSGQREVVVVGGTNKLRTDCIDLNEVEIINVDTNEVRNGKWNKVQVRLLRDTCHFIISATNFPYHVKFHASLNYEDSFLLMGGQYRSNCSLSVGQKNWIYQ